MVYQQDLVMVKLGTQRLQYKGELIMITLKTFLDITFGVVKTKLCIINIDEYIDKIPEELKWLIDLGVLDEEEVVGKLSGRFDSKKFLLEDMKQLEPYMDYEMCHFTQHLPLEGHPDQDIYLREIRES